MSNIRQDGDRSAASLRIAVVDDDPLVLGMLGDMLVECGHSAFCFVSSTAALAACIEVDFAAVLFDVSMPQLSGFEFYDRLCEARPDYRGRTVLLTGDIYAPETQRFLLSVGCLYLSKPFRRSQLQNALIKAGIRAATLPQQPPLPKAA